MRLTNANRKAVVYACRNYHYSKCAPAGIQYAYNVYNADNDWCGVVLFSGGANRNIGSPFGLKYGEVLELTRVALNGKQETTSKAVAMALKRLKRDDPLCKLVVSYADIDQDHYGIIYQATNWIYLGDMKGQEYFIINGRHVHKKNLARSGETLSESFERVKRYKDPSAKRVMSKGKRKYVFCFEKKMRKKYLKQAKPYPKRKESEMVANGKEEP